MVAEEADARSNATNEVIEKSRRIQHLCDWLTVLSAILPSLADRRSRVIAPPAPFALGTDGPLGDQLLESSPEGALRDLGPNAAVDVRGCRAGIALDVFDDERSKSMGLDALSVVWLSSPASRRRAGGTK